MSSQTAYPGAAADLSTTPTGWFAPGIPWTGVSNLIGGLNGSGVASASVKSVNAPTDILLAYDFGMGGLVPGGSTVNGVGASITKDCAIVNFAEDDYVYLTTDSSADILSGTSNQAASGFYVGTPTAVNYGGPTSFWGLGSIALSTVTASGFGFGLQVTSTGSGTHAVNVPFMQLTIYYTASAGSTFPAALIGTFVFLGGAWLPFTLELARALGNQVCLFKQTGLPRRVISVPVRRLILPKLVLPKRFQVARPETIIVC